MAFTLDNYEVLLQGIKEKFEFISFTSQPRSRRVALWRHDIDFSPNRALKMAEIESKHNLYSTYFIQLSSLFYSCFEPRITKMLLDIHQLGHQLGLHFDASIYHINTIDQIEKKLSFEAQVLEELLGISIESFSLHNPTILEKNLLNGRNHCDLINASSSHYFDDFEYFSDSNGLWKFRSPDVVLENHKLEQNIYVLTHAEWWQDIEMLPRERIERCIQGRAQRCIEYYDDLLRDNGRPNQVS